MSALKPVAILRTALVFALLLAGPALFFQRAAADDPGPSLTALTLQRSADKVTWTSVYGNLAGGFRMDLDPAVQFYYLDVASLTASEPLANGLHPFKLNTANLPPGYYPYWAAKGVTADAEAGSWQAWMWEIINGRQPMFYLQVADGPAYRLLDGLLYDYMHMDEFLRVSGDYPVAVYTFDGTITDQDGAPAPVVAQISFEPFAKISSLTLKQTADKSTWVDVSGDLAEGYAMALDPTVPFYYIDVKALTANKLLSVGAPHSLFLDPTEVPEGFWDYWAAKGVTAGLDPDTWQAWMWRIINGWERMAWMLNMDNIRYTLFDGLLYHSGTLEFLRISGDYPLGKYTFNFVYFDPIGGQTVDRLDMTFTRLAPPQAPDVKVQKADQDLQLKWDAITQDVNGANTAIKTYQVYRSSDPYFDPGDVSSPEPLAEISTTEYADVGVMAGVDGYFYVVRAANSIGPSADSNRTGKFTLALRPGETP